ncbi:DUF255 domain-containing protein [Aliiroseovarius subalbicans]|uniref:DUF255 domain-containing protein n=1 Tax=Aliiroseovarius subalbicans TaxID=2925840 RepID=UPI001F57E30B|nr:DUF255 domain-containing protein [Aliiroseovarius subalbicans]MCI2399643.1 DUF255 domain-containing protein [Aliiroseovarius subalbicans]
MRKLLPSFLIVLTLLVPPHRALAEERTPNHLEGTRSPYLLQHLYNPVDWYPWGPEALKKARAENKPIFISVGYSACHWCHVMERESFEDEAIAALLNAHFVSIKIDRETRPDLDEQFMFVTQLLTGGGGWPNSVFLTPQGDPFSAGGYMQPETFAATLERVRAAWDQDPAFVSAEAARVTRTARAYLSRKAEARAVTPAIVKQLADELLPEMDPFNGGFGTAPKFPREAMFLFLLDQAERTGDRWMLRNVTDMLDGMIRGGIHDHVGGGFHRYAVDPEWHVPHFEKMLYTQALTGRLLIRAWRITGAPQYRRAAERLFDFVLRDMRGPGGGFYSALDADSFDDAGNLVEGAFYTWTPEALAALGQDTVFARDLFQVSEDGELDGANILNLVDLPADTARMDATLARMWELRSARPAPFLDRKVVVDWNAAMIETLAEASYLLDRPDYYEAAETAARFILEHMREDEGLRRLWFEGVSEGAAHLSDHAGLALALVALHDHTSDRAAADHWLSEGKALADDIPARFGTADTGFHMTQIADGLGVVIPVDDGDLPSGNALALSLFARLSHRAAVPALDQAGFHLSSALSGHALSAPAQRGMALTAIRSLQAGETGPLRYAAKGAVRVELQHAWSESEVEIVLDIAKGWHINAHAPLEPYFIATNLTVTDAGEVAVSYPDPIIKTLSFNDAPLALYEGRVRLFAQLPEKDAAGAATLAKVTFQACSDEICLQPEELIFALW